MATNQASDVVTKSLAPAFEQAGQKHEELQQQPDPAQPEEPKAEPPKDTASARVHNVLKANKERQKSAADVLRQALLALGPPGTIPQDVLLKELANLHAQVHAGEGKDPDALGASGKKAEPVKPPVVHRTPVPPAGPPPVTVPPPGSHAPLDPPSPVPSLGGTTMQLGDPSPKAIENARAFALFPSPKPPVETPPPVGPVETPPPVGTPPLVETLAEVAGGEPGDADVAMQLEALR